MNTVKASLKVALYADAVLVAESEDAKLWQEVLRVINGADQIGSFKMAQKDSFEGLDGGKRGAHHVDDPGAESHKEVSNPVDKFAAYIGVSPEEAQAACDPTVAEPFMLLEQDAWAAFKSQLGDRGPLAVAPIAAVATLLALWFKHTNGSTNATQAQVQAVLKSINVRDSNPARGIRRTSWLQARPGGQIILNPAKIAQAKLFAKCFCSHQWAEWKAD